MVSYRRSHHGMVVAMKKVHHAIRVARQAGRVERLHTVPHHVPHSVASHSWSVAVLILLLHPKPSVRLLKAALLHDAAEAEIGDLPSPSKLKYPTLAKELSI